ncbi:MAG TPA: prephenate dehydrogenase/arogenate dehydrogenase family protein [Myxococcota bacterium]
MKPLFERIAVIGLGLLGGSVAAAVQRRGVATKVAGASRSSDARNFALRRQWVDEVGSAAGAATGADLVVLATPVFAMADVLRELAPALRSAAIVTDVGSVKAQLAETLPGLLPTGVYYVGSHPMAGSHERGIEYARADLFEDSPCIVTESGQPEAQQRVCAFWRALGARVVMRDPAAHDEQVAWTSHTPHVLAFGFAAALARAPEGSGDLTGGGFRDFTRIAESNPELWGDILTANRKALGAPLAAVGEALRELGQAIEANDPESVERWISGARDALALAIRSTPRARSMDEGHASSDNHPSPAEGGSAVGGRKRKQT